MKTRQNSSQLICGISILLLSLAVACAAEPFENLPADTIIAKVCDHNVSFGDIEPNSILAKKHQASDSNEQFKLWLKQTMSANLGQFFKPLWDDFEKEKKLEVTRQEIDDFKERMINAMTAEAGKWKIKRDGLAKELLAVNLKGDKKAELEKNFKLYNNLIENSPDPKLIYNSPDSNTARVADNTTKTFILRWKIGRELYKQYNGRVVFQQAGPEPLDAYRLFFEEQQSKGKFKFYNKDAEDLFWDYRRNTGHTFIKDPNEAEQMMNVPWWQKEKGDEYYNDYAEWGNDANGLQIRINGARGTGIFVSDRAPAFMMDSLNTGDKTYACPALQQYCQVEIDGKWYAWNGPKTDEILAMELGSKKVGYDFLEIELNGNWVPKEGDQKQPLSLPVGVHTIRVKYKTAQTYGRTEIEAVSNLLKFKIIPSQDTKKE